ncbi:MAG: hypothetical protein HY327_06285 [Chloroflexi bacterium]|nr:hypothetical protein [Chloroflexota bacterium]
MSTISVELWDDRGKFVAGNISVVCTEPQARQIEKMKQATRFNARTLRAGVSRYMTFEQFKRLFLPK